MRVICLVPSWTETLIECGVNVVGRTRFCIHPKNQLKEILPVGGTKDIDWVKVHSLKADLLILDQEENLHWMKEQSPIPVHVTHVQGLESMAGEMARFAALFPEQEIAFLNLKERWDQILSNSSLAVWDFAQIPGEIEKLTNESQVFNRIVYVIWKDPWMRVATQTFIGSVLKTLGAGPWLEEPAQDANPSKYPEFNLLDFDLKKTYFLFSSEPFPFHRKKKKLEALGVQGSIVDGESYSWFGIRSLQFLEQALSKI